MGIRFACHMCGMQLNIKRELAGKRGVCPQCSARFRIPSDDAATSVSTEADSSPPSEQASEQASGLSLSADATATKPSQYESPALDLLGEDSEATWYVRPPSGGQYGPATTDVLKQWIDEGRVAATSLLWRDGWPQWRSADDAFPEIASSLPSGDSTPNATLALHSSPATRPRNEANSSESTVSAPQLSGEADVGTGRRSRSLRRALWIGVLSAIALTLLGVLLVVVNR